MAAPSYTYTLTNGSTADASQLMQNLNDILNGVTDGTKDLSISALTCAGTATLNGHVNLGNSTSDDLTITASLAASLAIKTNNSFDIGSATLGLRKLYLGNGGAGATCDIVSASHGTTREYTIIDCGGPAYFVMTEGAQTINGLKTYGTGLKLPTTGGTASQLDYYELATASVYWTANNSAANTGTVTAKYTRIGDSVVLKFPVVGCTTNASDVALQLSAALPTNFRPAAEVMVTGGHLLSGGTQVATVKFRVKTDGTVICYRDGGGSTGFGAGSTGWDYANTVIYNIT